MWVHLTCSVKQEEVYLSWVLIFLKKKKKGACLGLSLGSTVPEIPWPCPFPLAWPEFGSSCSLSQWFPILCQVHTGWLSLEPSRQEAHQHGQIHCSLACPSSSFLPGRVLLHLRSSNTPRHLQPHHPPPDTWPQPLCLSCLCGCPSSSESFGDEGTSPPNRMPRKCVCSLLPRKRSC